MASLTVCTGTPTLTVRDNRGLAVRTLRYNRSQAGDVATQLVERNTFNDLGQPLTSQDARFFAQGDSAPTFNFQHTPALSGQMLQTLSADAGTTQTFCDIAGRPIWQRDARGTVQTLTYDALGRPLTRSEQLQGAETSVVRERWAYGESLAVPPGDYAPSAVADPRNRNQRGQAVKHYDTAGLLDTSEMGYTLQGAPQRQGRTLLPPEIASDWSGADDSSWQAKLTGQTPYATTWAYNALTQVLTQSDAKGHLQSTTYDIAGRKLTSSVTPQGGKNTPVTTGITYAAGGQILAKTDANGVSTTHTYEPQTTQRVLGIKVTRAAPQATLQDLAYTYDPVGNVVGMTDKAAQINYFNNQATPATRTYTYDALYQLIAATGRENAVSSPSGTDSPEAFAPPITANYRSYTRSYAYDLGGNLTQLAPGNSLPNRSMTVASTSNRAVSNINATAVTSATVTTYFDDAGNPKYLDGNMLQPVTWSGQNQLQQLVMLYRGSDPAQNDRESYAYGGDGQRVRKTSFAKANNGNWNQSDAIYLPGLEIRSQTAGEQLEVIVLDDGARVLNWTKNQPDTIKNQQLRYPISERQGSCQLELDDSGAIITQEEYYPYGGTAVRACRSSSEATYKTIRYSGKERDAAGLYYYGFRYYQPWIGRWTSPDPAGTVDGLNMFCMVGNNPVTLTDAAGLQSDSEDDDQMEIAKNDSFAESQNRSRQQEGRESPASAASSSGQFLQAQMLTAGSKRLSTTSTTSETSLSSEAKRIRIDEHEPIGETVNAGKANLRANLSANRGGMRFSRLESNSSAGSPALHAIDGSPYSALLDSGPHSQASTSSATADANTVASVRASTLITSLGQQWMKRLDTDANDISNIDAKIKEINNLIDNQKKNNAAALKKIKTSSNEDKSVLAKENQAALKNLQDKHQPTLNRLIEEKNSILKNQETNFSQSLGYLFPSATTIKVGVSNIFHETFKSRATANQHLGLAIGILGSGKIFGYTDVQVNIVKDINQLEAYKRNLVTRDSENMPLKKNYYNKLTNPEDLQIFFKEVDGFLTEKSKKPLHPVTQMRIHEFNESPTKLDDFSSIKIKESGETVSQVNREDFFSPTQHPGHANVLGLHAESIVYNEMLWKLYPAPSKYLLTDLLNLQSETHLMARAADKILNGKFHIHTYKTINSQNGWRFPACVGCRAIARQFTEVNASGDANIKTAKLITELGGLTLEQVIEYLYKKGVRPH